MPEKPLEMEEPGWNSRQKVAKSPPMHTEGHSEPIILLQHTSEPGAEAQDDTEGDVRESALESEIVFKHPTIPGLVFKKESASLLAPSPLPRRRRRRSGRSRSKSLHTSEADDDSDDEDKKEQPQSSQDKEAQSSANTTKPTRPSRKRKPKSTKQLQKAVSEPELPSPPHHRFSHELPTHDTSVDDIELPDEMAYGDECSASQSRSCDVGYVSGPATQAEELETRARSETPSEITKEGFADAETDAPPILKSPKAAKSGGGKKAVKKARRT